jgi:hypothetical protein
VSFEPYTHQMHGQRCHEAGKQGYVLASQLVQVRKHGVVYCARLSAPYTVPNGPDCWTVESITPQVARFTVPVRQVVLCGDAACSCVAVAAGPEASEADSACGNCGEAK